MIRRQATFLRGDALAVLRTIPDESVVTSPPYWGLRDYQTGKWKGGDPACRDWCSRLAAGFAEPYPMSRWGKMMSIENLNPDELGPLVEGPGEALKVSRERMDYVLVV